MSTNEKLHLAAVTAAALSAVLLSACSTSALNSNAASADTVVYGKIYTSSPARDYAEAFAVKDGKYVYVGSADGAKKFITPSTEVIDRRGKGLVMAGATEGHGHYTLATVMNYKGFLMNTAAGSKREITDYLKQHIARHPDEKHYFLYGWNNQRMLNEKDKIDMRAALDNVCADKIVVLMDDSGHNCFLNSKAIEAAGLTASTEIKGGFIAKNKNGRLLGLVSDTAAFYACARIIDKNEFATVDDFTSSLPLCQDLLHSLGYTNYFDANTAFLGDVSYKAISQYDKTKGLTLNIGASYKLDVFDNIDKTLDKVATLKARYSTRHFMPNSIKLFADGECVETYSGWVKLPYKNGTTGMQVWPTPTFNYIVKSANARGLSVHTHASGDAAVEQAVNAYILAEPAAQPGVLNCIGHTRNVTEESKDQMAKHHIKSATNILWRMGITSQLDTLWTKIDRGYFMAGYPLKSMLDRGIVLTSSTDYPANSGVPCDVASIIELAVNGTVNPDLIPKNAIFPLDAREQISREEALDVLTINGARQLGLEKERGSIEAGKYADFLFLATDITTSPKNEIHNGQVETVYFEGKKVFEK